MKPGKRAESVLHSRDSQRKCYLSSQLGGRIRDCSKKSLLNQRLLSVSWHDGEFVKQELTREQIQVRRSYITAQIEKVERACKIEPVTAPDIPSDLAEVAASVFGSKIMDAANLAGQNCALLSEDMYYRRFAQSTVGARGAWLQIVLMVALEVGVIDDERYSSSVVSLAARSHSHVALDKDALLCTLRGDDMPNLQRFRTLAEFIGSTNADMRSHVAVVKEFLDETWEPNDFNSLRTQVATAVLIERLIRHQEVGWPIILAFLSYRAKRSLRTYIEGWVLGHFLPINLVRDAEQRLEQAAHATVAGGPNF